MVEYLDIIDEEENIIKKRVLREEAHKKGLLHKVVVVWIINQENKILIQKRSAKKKVSPNQWSSSVGGHISSGENSILTAVRETKEELGLNLKEEDLYLAFKRKRDHIGESDTINELMDVYFVKINFFSDDIKLQEDEVSDFKLIEIGNFISDFDKYFSRFSKGYKDDILKVLETKFL